MLTVYARREPTTDAATLEMRRLDPGAFKGAHDVQIYRDADASAAFGRFPHDRSNKPTRRHKTVTLNCYRYRLEWLEDLAAPLEPSESILARSDRLGLRVVTYTNKTTAAHSDGSRYWIPRDAVGKDGRAGIFFRPADAHRRDLPGALYDFDGWEPWADGAHGGTMFGGRHCTYEGALAWMEHYAPERLK